jgi:hypothetical protein
MSMHRLGIIIFLWFYVLNVLLSSRNWEINFNPELCASSFKNKGKTLNYWNVIYFGFVSKLLKVHSHFVAVAFSRFSSHQSEMFWYFSKRSFFEGSKSWNGIHAKQFIYMHNDFAYRKPTTKMRYCIYTKTALSNAPKPRNRQTIRKEPHRILPN